MRVCANECTSLCLLELVDECVCVWDDFGSYGSHGVLSLPLPLTLPLLLLSLLVLLLLCLCVCCV